MPADQAVVGLFAPVARKGVLSQKKSSPYRILSEQTRCQRRKCKVIVVRIGVGQHVVFFSVIDVIAVRKPRDPSPDLPLLHPVQFSELLPGPGSPVIDQPVLRNGIVVHSLSGALHHSEKHLFVIAAQTVNVFTGSVQMHDKEKCFERICPPVDIVSQKIQFISLLRRKLYFFEQLLKLRQSSMNVPDHICRQGSVPSILLLRAAAFDAATRKAAGRHSFRPPAY